MSINFFGREPALFTTKSKADEIAERFMCAANQTMNTSIVPITRRSQVVGYSLRLNGRQVTEEMLG